MMLFWSNRGFERLSGVGVLTGESFLRGGPSREPQFLPEGWQL